MGAGEIHRSQRKRDRPCGPCQSSAFLKEAPLDQVLKYKRMSRRWTEIVRQGLFFGFCGFFLSRLNQAVPDVSIFNRAPHSCDWNPGAFSLHSNCLPHQALWESDLVITKWCSEPTITGISPRGLNLRPEMCPQTDPKTGTTNRHHQ